MRKNLFVMGFSIILVVGVFSGCQEEQAGVITFEGITLISGIVELVNASLDFYYDSFDMIKRVEVKYLFHNIADRGILVNITVKFCDENDNLLETSDPKYIRLLDDYTEKGYGLANIISYEGENVHLVDHVKIIAIEEVED